MSTNVGLVAWVATPRPRTSPWMKQVLPAPSSPARATTSPASRVRPRRSPAASVSAGLRATSAASAVIAREGGERLGQRGDHVARHQRLLAQARGGEISRPALQIYR